MGHRGGYNIYRGRGRERAYSSSPGCFPAGRFRSLFRKVGLLPRSARDLQLPAQPMGNVPWGILPPMGHLALPCLHLPGRDAGFQVGGYSVPKGTALFMSIFAVHHDEAAWPRAEEFIPERHMEVCVRGVGVGVGVHALTSLSRRGHLCGCACLAHTHACVHTCVCMYTGLYAARLRQAQPMHPCIWLLSSAAVSARAPGRACTPAQQLHPLRRRRAHVHRLQVRAAGAARAGPWVSQGRQPRADADASSERALPLFPTMTWLRVCGKATSFHAL